MGLGRAFAVVVLFVLALPVAYAVTDLRVPGVPQDVTSAASIANYETALHSNYMEWARRTMIYCRSGMALWANRDRDYTCYDWLASAYQPPKRAVYPVPEGPRDETRAYTKDAWELMRRQAMGWLPTGPKDEAVASSQSILALMQKTGPPSGPRDMAKATQLSNWELMQRQAGPSGPRDENGRGSLQGEELVQKLADATMRDARLYASRPAPKAAEASAPVREGRAY